VSAKSSLEVKFITCVALRLANWALLNPVIWFVANDWICVVVSAEIKPVLRPWMVCKPSAWIAVVLRLCTFELFNEFKDETVINGKLERPQGKPPSHSIQKFMSEFEI
jgi:hypothetical protein